MASGGDSLQEALREEATCSICLDYFAIPVAIECGHSFCQACLVQYWAESSTGPPCCPQCREASQQRLLRPNLQLANLVQLVKKIEADAGEDLPWAESDRSKGDHLGRHDASVAADEASLQYKGKIKSHLAYLQKEREKLMDLKLAEELRRQDFLMLFETEKKKAQSAFERMQKFLLEKQHFWLGQLEDLEKAMERMQEENLAKVSKEISRLNELIAEMKSKSLQPVSELLEDTRCSLSRFEKNLEGHSVVLSPRLEEKFQAYSQKNAALEKAMENYKESLEQILQPDYLKQTMQKANVTLDPDTAHPLLILSQDLKGVRRVQREQILPFNPERFDIMPYVLGCNRFAAGRHWWEVEVWGKATWAVGVATESVRRKGDIEISPYEGIWAMGKPPCYSPSPCRFLAFTSPQPTDLTLRREPRKIRVALDCEAGSVEFSDADTEEFIFAFPPGSFFGEKIRPFLQVCCDVSLKC